MFVVVVYLHLTLTFILCIRNVRDGKDGGGTVLHLPALYCPYGVVSPGCGRRRNGGRNLICLLLHNESEENKKKDDNDYTEETEDGDSNISGYGG